ncbi:P-loop containing nucleoside triphosphate hydrolase protein [Ochromonadaceae sp. CCMP2298]|nr:P-loop containing nucleoside triphosphate hydrolase protein [Ochromonadaceae sp. CCMP2298]
MDAESCVKVAVRIRPLSKDDEKRDTSECVKTIPEKSQIKAGNDIFELSFTYDHVFGSDSEQSDLYEACVPDLVEAFFDGFNATILAYGQTGSGKTWTMGSSSDMHMSPETIGIIPRMIENLFVDVRKREADEPGSSYTIHVQFLEIYGEDIRDLLDVTKKSDVMIRETKEDGVYVTGAREELVTSFEQMMRLLEIGTRQRVTASTKKNAVSSRSHAIFTVMLAHTMPSTKGSDPAKRMREVLRSKFHFVDLAGSERAKRTGAEGQRMKEGIDINKGLLALGNVISALGDDSKRGKNTFVPYRDSKLTRILKDSLGGNSKTLMICCVSPASVNFNESLNALRYADRARSIKNKPVITRDPTLVMIDEFKHQLKVVSCELLEMRRMRAFVEVDNPVPMELLESWAGQPSTASEKDVDEALARIKNQIAGAVEGAVTPEVAHDDADVQGQELLRQLEIDLSSSTPPSRGFTKDDLSELEAMGGGEGLLSYNEGHLSSKEAAEATLAELRNELKQLGLDHELADEHVDEHVDEPTPEAATDAEIAKATHP